VLPVDVYHLPDSLACSIPTASDALQQQQQYYHTGSSRRRRLQLPTVQGWSSVCRVAIEDTLVSTRTD
jgi:hypothetical protein